MKTDKSVIADLPDKTEVNAFCSSAANAGGAIRRKRLRTWLSILEKSMGIQRKGIVLAFADAAEADLQSSIAMARRRRLDRGGQRQIGAPAARSPRTWPRGRKRRWSSPSFARSRPAGQFLAGSTDGRVLSFTAIRRLGTAANLVQTFQEDGPPFFVLSLKAGGTGLKLTAASHVIHFDRWWNPAVENQATDRAFRIGQKATFWCTNSSAVVRSRKRSTQLIEAKKALSDDLAGRRRRET